jgi:hypothetical protein
MIVTDYYNSHEVTVNTAENISLRKNDYAVYKLNDGSYCRPVMINSAQEMIKCDRLGDTWFVIPTENLDIPLDSAIINQMVDAYGQEYVNGFTTSRDFHTFINDLGDGTSEIKSGIYPINFKSRTLPTFDIEYQMYYDLFALPDNSNINVNSSL